MATDPRSRGLLLACSAVLSLTGCEAVVDDGSVGSRGSTTTLNASGRSCIIPEALIIDGGPGVDGIPALTNPTFVQSSSPLAAYLRDEDRVIGLVADGQPLAVPINILWWHEIVNVAGGIAHLAVTHCPLTGSSLTFKRSVINSAELGVSGLLFINNLMMYDRTATPSLWPQMSRGARCGPASGDALPMFPSFEMTWKGWLSLYPSTLVVSSETGYERDYRRYPYDRYDELDNPVVFGPLPDRLDRRRPPKERVLGLPAGDSAGVALPFGVLDSLGSAAVAHVTANERSAVVFWKRDLVAATAFFSEGPSGPLTFRAEGEALLDVETGSEWRADGIAIAGPLAGAQLEPVTDAFVAYWFAWAAFYPQADLWLGPAPQP